jgi:hypothetical protein
LRAWYPAQRRSLITIQQTAYRWARCRSDAVAVSLIIKWFNEWAMNGEQQNLRNALV